MTGDDTRGARQLGLACAAGGCPTFIRPFKGLNHLEHNIALNEPTFAAVQILSSDFVSPNNFEF